MGDDAAGGPAFGHGHVPLCRCRLHQHHARRGAAFAYIFGALADALATAGTKIAPDAIACQVLAGRGVFGTHLGPVCIELFGHQLRQAGERALAHFRAGNADDDGVVRIHHDPGIDFGGQRRLRDCFAREWNMKRNDQPTGGGHRAAKKGATRQAILWLTGCFEVRCLH